MARPSGFDRAAAVHTAMQAIWRDGYEKNSVLALSEKLGITRSSYYNAFGSRDALFREVLAAYFSQSPDRALHAEAPTGRVLELLTSTFKAVCAARASDPEGRGCLAVNSIGELAGSHSELGPLLQQAVLQSAERLEQLLNLAEEDGELPSGYDTHGAALALQNLLVGINTLSKVVREYDELWLAVRTTLRGLGVLREGDCEGCAPAAIPAESSPRM
jgi:TetR/AcrR family transcriptional regulator, transcriptional repressor for nem operon